ncbi:Pycsar system effector family protein [Streptomyces sp. NPDC054841]
MTASQPDNAGIQAYADRLLANARDEVKQADAKASLLLAASGVALGAVLSVALSEGKSFVSMANSVEWLWWTGLAAATAGVGLLGYAVFPRSSRTADAPDHLVAYFGDVAEHPRATLEARIARTLQTSTASSLDQLYEVARIAASKYALIRRALCLFATAGVLCAAGLLLNLVV